VLHKLYTSPNITRVIKSRSIRLEGHVAFKAQVRNAYKILARGKRPLGRRRPWWKDNIRMDCW